MEGQIDEYAWGREGRRESGKREKEEEKIRVGGIERVQLFDSVPQC